MTEYIQIQINSMEDKHNYLLMRVCSSSVNFVQMLGLLKFMQIHTMYMNLYTRLKLKICSFPKPYSRNGAYFIYLLTIP